MDAMLSPDLTHDLNRNAAAISPPIESHGGWIKGNKYE
jgi:hypothetical protein